MNYLPDWPCKICSKKFKYHQKRGEISPDGSEWLDNWCNAEATFEERVIGRNFYFQPMSNLEYLESKTLTNN
jgi:hypothetical protein